MFAKNEYNLELVNDKKINRSDVIILAVAHDKYADMNLDEWEELLNDNGIFMDVKAINSNNFFSGSNIKYWQL